MGDPRGTKAECRAPDRLQDCVPIEKKGSAQGTTVTGAAEAQCTSTQHCIVTCPIGDSCLFKLEESDVEGD